MGKIELREKTVVITGASGGIGGEVAMAFARRGAKLVLSGRNRDALSTVADRVRLTGAEAHVVTADVTKWGEVQALVERAIEVTGGLHVMMLGAGFGLLGDIANVTLEMWHKEMDVNFWGVLHGFYASLPHFQKQGSGSFIIMNSLSGRIAMPLSAPYCASKFALWGFADSIRAELARKKIDLLSVYPNFVKTSFQANTQSPDFKIPPDIAWKLHGQDPKHVADLIVRYCERGKGELVLTAMGHVGVRLMGLSYHISEWSRRYLMMPITKRMMIPR